MIIFMKNKIINKLLKIINSIFIFEFIIYAVLESKQLVLLLVYNRGILTNNDIKLFVINLIFAFFLASNLLFSYNYKDIIIKTKKRFLIALIFILFIPFIKLISVYLANLIGSNKQYFTGYGYEPLTIVIQQKIAIFALVGAFVVSHIVRKIIR